MIHSLIEAQYEQFMDDGFTRIHREYGRQRNSPIGNHSIDLIYFSHYNIQVDRQLFDFGGLTIGEIYEIEPITNTKQPHGSFQAAVYALMLTENKEKLIGKVTDLNGIYDGFEYDWRYVRWELGDSIPSTVFSLYNGIVFWKQKRGLIVYINPEDERQVREVMVNPAYATVRHSVATHLPDEVLEKYTAELANSATMCYTGLQPKYWDPGYRDPYWWWYQYWVERTKCSLNPNGTCRQVIGE